MNHNTFAQCLASNQINLISSRLSSAVASSQDMKEWSRRDIANILLPGNVSIAENSGLKVLLHKAVSQGVLELVGSNYKIKGHAGKSKGRKKSGSKKRKGSKKGGKKGGKKSGRKSSKKGKAPASPTQ